MSNHYALLFNRRKAKLSFKQKFVYDGKLKHVQKILSSSTEIDGSGARVRQIKERKQKLGERHGDEMKILHDSSKATDMAAG